MIETKEITKLKERLEEKENKKVVGIFFDLSDFTKKRILPYKKSKDMDKLIKQSQNNLLLKGLNKMREDKDILVVIKNDLFLLNKYQHSLVEEQLKNK